MATPKPTRDFDAEREASYYSADERTVKIGGVLITARRAVHPDKIEPWFRDDGSDRARSAELQQEAIIACLEPDSAERWVDACAVTEPEEAIIRGRDRMELLLHCMRIVGGRPLGDASDSTDGPETDASGTPSTDASSSPAARASRRSTSGAS